MEELKVHDNIKAIPLNIKQEDCAAMTSSMLEIVKQVNETKSNGIYITLLDPGGSNIMVK